MKKFDSLSEREILALAISLEEEDERVYADFAEGLRESFPASAAVFEAMRADETGHRQRLLSLYQKQFGDHIPLIRRQDVRGFVHRMPVWLVRPLGLDAVRKQASAIEFETRRFYERAASRAKDVNVRQLLDDLAEEERGHEGRAQELTEQNLPPEIRENERPGAPAPVCFADRTARSCRSDGWIGVDSRACFLLRRWRAEILGTPSWLAWPPHSVQASAWDSRRHCRMMAA